jgi:hypothetical protein
VELRDTTRNAEGTALSAGESYTVVDRIHRKTL